MFITDDIRYVGVNDHDIDLFEGQYVVENGMAYNSYVIMDEQIAVMDTVDGNFTDEWLKNISDVIGDRKPSYLIVQHMEPDHSANVANFLDLYKDAKVVATAKAFVMMKQFFGTDYPERQIVVKEGDTLSLGTHTLTFVLAPMVHWPEVMVTYDSKDKVLFSADAFGKFGALHWMLRKTGLAKQDAIISELLENTALRYRHFLRRLPVLISRPSVHSMARSSKRILAIILISTIHGPATVLRAKALSSLTHLFTAILRKPLSSLQIN